MLVQDLDAPQCPAKALLLETVEGERHHSLAAGLGHVDPAPSTAEEAQAGLRVLGDAGLVPAPDRLQGAPPEESHGAGEDDRVPVRAGRHAECEEVAVAVVKPAQVGFVLPTAVLLRRLHEGDARVGEVARHVAQPVGIDRVVRVDHADHLHLLGQPACGLVERARLIPGPILKVEEGEPGAEAAAVILDRPPERRVGGVVVDHLHQQPRVVETRERLQGAGHDVHRLVVGGDLEGHHRQVIGRRRRQRLLPPAEHVQHLEHVVDGKRQRARLHQEQRTGDGQAQSAEAFDDGEGAGVDEIRDGREDGGGQELARDPAPTPQQQTQGQGCEEGQTGETRHEISIPAEHEGQDIARAGEDGRSKRKAEPDPRARQPRDQGQSCRRTNRQGVETKSLK